MSPAQRLVNRLIDASAENVKLLWGDDPQDDIAVELDLDDAPPMTVIEQARDIVRADAARYLADAPAVLTVYRAGPFRGRWTSVTRQRSTAETHAAFGGNGGTVDIYTVLKDRVMAAMMAYPRSYAEDELVVMAEDLTPVHTAAWGDNDPEAQRALEDLAEVIVSSPGHVERYDPSADYGGYISEGRSGLLLDGAPPRFLYRVVDPDEWAQAQAQGFLQSRGGYTRASAKPDERWRYQGDAGVRGLTLEIDYDPADGWTASAEGYAATHRPIPLSRVRKVGHTAATNDIYAIETAWNRLKEEDEPYFSEIYELGELQALFREVLTDEGVPYGDEAYLVWGPDPWKSSTGLDVADGCRIPIAQIGSEMANPVTVLHEAAHFVVGSVDPFYRPEGVDLIRAIDSAHDIRFRATFARLLRRWFPEADDLAMRLVSAKTDPEHIGELKKFDLKRVAKSDDEVRDVWRGIRLDGDYATTQKWLHGSLSVSDLRTMGLNLNNLGPYWAWDRSMSDGYAGLDEFDDEDWAVQMWEEETRTPEWGPDDERIWQQLWDSANRPWNPDDEPYLKMLTRYPDDEWAKQELEKSRREHEEWAAKTRADLQRNHGVVPKPKPDLTGPGGMGSVMVHGRIRGTKGWVPDMGMTDATDWLNRDMVQLAAGTPIEIVGIEACLDGRTWKPVSGASGMRITASWGDDPETQAALEDLADAILSSPTHVAPFDPSDYYGGTIQQGRGEILLDGERPRVLYRVVDPAEWSQAQTQGYLQSRGGYTRASAQPDERWRYQGEAGVRGITLEIDYDPSDDWTASAEGYAATHSRIPLSRVRVVGIKTAGFDERLGRCYELAAKHVAYTDDGSVLVHGSIEGMGNPRLAHAWARLPDGSVWEPITEETYDEQSWRLMFHPEEYLTYTQDEVLIHLARDKHWGPWDPAASPDNIRHAHVAKVDGEVRDVWRGFNLSAHSLDPAVIERWDQGTLTVHDLGLDLANLGVFWAYERSMADDYATGNDNYQIALDYEGHALAVIVHGRVDGTDGFAGGPNSGADWMLQLLDGTPVEIVGVEACLDGRTWKPVSGTFGMRITASMDDWEAKGVNGWYDDPGPLTVYHGTTRSHLDGIRQDGLAPPPGVNPAMWFMVTTDPGQARRYAQGDDAVVLEYRIPADQVTEYLWPPHRHDVYGFDAWAMGIRKPLPSSMLVSSKTAGSDDYRMQHQPLGPGDDVGACITNMEECFPADVYEHPEWYSASGQYQEIKSILNRARNNPSAMIDVYRAVPPGVTSIENGNWVAIIEEYARGHAMQDDDPGHDWPVLKATVPASTIWTGGDDLNEWGYWGPDITNVRLAKIASGGTYYHATPAENVPGILARGLVPQGARSQAWGDYIEIDPDVVYLAASMVDAENWGAEVAQAVVRADDPDYDPDSEMENYEPGPFDDEPGYPSHFYVEIAILEVRVPDGLKVEEHYHADGKEILVHGSIPPANIREVKTFTLADDPERFGFYMEAAKTGSLSVYEAEGEIPRALYGLRPLSRNEAESRAQVMLGRPVDFIDATPGMSFMSGDRVAVALWMDHRGSLVPVIVVKDWSAFDAMVLAHEVAHLLDDQGKGSYKDYLTGGEGHGPSWASVYLGLVETHVSSDLADNLRSRLVAREAKTAGVTPVMYHQSHPKDRKSIQERGLLTRRPDNGYSFAADDGHSEAGVYLISRDQRWRAFEDHGWDVWEVNVEGLEVKPDTPLQEFKWDSWYVPHDIEPSRIRLVQKADLRAVASGDWYYHAGITAKVASSSSGFPVEDVEQIAGSTSWHRGVWTGVVAADEPGYSSIGYRGMGNVEELRQALRDGEWQSDASFTLGFEGRTQFTVDPDEAARFRDVRVVVAVELAGLPFKTIVPPVEGDIIYVPASTGEGLGIEGAIQARRILRIGRVENDRVVEWMEPYALLDPESDAWAKVASSDGDEPKVCSDGIERWGLYGAAGVLFFYVDDHGTRHYFLQLRSGDVDEGGTWGIPGGAISEDEDPVQGALREFAEEVGFVPDHDIVRTYVDQVADDWAYTTVIAQVPKTFDHDGSTWEASHGAWFTISEMRDLNLHPAFAEALPKVASAPQKIEGLDVEEGCPLYRGIQISTWGLDGPMTADNVVEWLKQDGRGLGGSWSLERSVAEGFSRPQDLIRPDLISILIEIQGWTWDQVADQNWVGQADFSDFKRGEFEIRFSRTADLNVTGVWVARQYQGFKRLGSAPRMASVADDLGVTWGVDGYGIAHLFRGSNIALCGIFVQRAPYVTQGVPCEACLTVATEEALSKTASNFSKGSISSWESTKPWEMTPEDLDYQRFDGFMSGTARDSGHMAYFDGSHIRVTPNFFTLPPEAKRGALYHEAGHGLCNDAGYDRVAAAYETPAMDLIDLPGAQGLGYNPDEIVAEAYAALWADPGWFDRMDTSGKLRKGTVALAREMGYPLPSGLKTAAWDDVRSKAKRIRSSGGVQVIAVADNGAVTAEVKGDHGVYQTTVWLTPRSRQLALWDCTCPWDTYAWARSGPWERLEGRPCAHALAVYYQIQSDKMFGGEVKPTKTEPSWSQEEVIPKPDRTMPRKWRVGARSWRAMGEGSFWDDFPAVIVSEGGGSGRRSYEVYDHGDLVATRETLAEAKEVVGDRWGRTVEWKTKRLDPMVTDHYYFGPVDWFGEPTTIWTGA